MIASSKTKEMLVRAISGEPIEEIFSDPSNHYSNDIYYIVLVCEKALAETPEKIVEDIKKGKTQALNVIYGKVQKNSYIPIDQGAIEEMIDYLLKIYPEKFNFLHLAWALENR